MTLPELAALALEHVPGFVCPIPAQCFDDNHGPTVFDNSPAALLMAVFERQLKGARKLETDRGDILICHDGTWGRAKSGETQESIARAALVALLRAHGVEVAE